MQDSNTSGKWRSVSLQEDALLELMKSFPKLARAEIVDAITRVGPHLSAVIERLEKLSLPKR
jgi:hypothetical protein